MEGLGLFIFKTLGPGPPSEDVKIRLRQEQRYQKSLFAAISGEVDATKKLELQKELVSCQRRIAGFMSVYPALEKLKDE